MTLTLDTTVAVNHRRGPNTQPAHIVAPGLAITPSLGVDGRYTLTHTESGKSVPYGAFCAEHVQEAAVVAAASGIDWSVPADRFDVAAGKRIADDMLRIVGRCEACPRGEAEPPEAATDDVRHVRIVAGSNFVVAYEGDDPIAVRWHADGVWYVTDGGAPRTFTDGQAAVRAFLASAGALPAEEVPA